MSTPEQELNKSLAEGNAVLTLAAAQTRLKEAGELLRAAQARDLSRRGEIQRLVTENSRLFNESKYLRAVLIDVRRSRLAWFFLPKIVCIWIDTILNETSRAD